MKPLLRDKRREDLIISIENSLLEEVLEILKKKLKVFLTYWSSLIYQHCILCYLYITSCVSEKKATGIAAGRILKRHLVKALDDKMWEDIVALHVAATWLDPTLKSLSFISHNEE